MRVGVTGHQNLPASALAYVRAQVEDFLGQCPQPLTGIASLAVGAYQLFAEAVLRHGGQLHVVVPSAGYEQTFGDEDRALYEKLRDAAAKVQTLEYPEPSEDAVLAAGSRVVDLCDLLVAVWDGKAARGRGGTADVVEYAKNNGKHVEIIWPAGVSR